MRQARRESGPCSQVRVGPARPTPARSGRAARALGEWAVRVLAGGAIAVLSFAAVGCAEPVSDARNSVGEAVQPAPWDLSTPEAAVRSYLGWVSFSYRMANSEIPTATMTPEEGVRVDAYIQLNRMEGRGIDQVLDEIEITGVTEESASAVVTARETWRYRYFSLDTLEYVSEAFIASYDTTYTLLAREDGWLVDRVEAAPNGEVK